MGLFREVWGALMKLADSFNQYRKVGGGAGKEREIDVMGYI